MRDSTRLYLGSKALDELPFLKELTIGTKLELTADAVVVSLSRGDSLEGKPSYSVEFALTNLKCSPTQSKKAEEMSAKEYRKMRENHKKD